MTVQPSEALIEAALEGHRARNEALVKRLSEFHVALDQPRAIDLHFFAPHIAAAQVIAAALEAQGLHDSKICPAGADGWISIEVAVTLPVNAVIARSFIEPLVRIASASGGEHDGWTTSIKEAKSTG